MKKKIFAFLVLLPFVTFTTYVFSDDDEDVEAVVVTGSYIKTDREEIDIPVDVFDRGEYPSAGAPNMREVLRNMPAITGTINQSEQFSDGGGTIVGLKTSIFEAWAYLEHLSFLMVRESVASAGTTKEGNAFL